jgi:TolA-binding protein
MNNERITVAENYMDDRGDSDLEKQIATLKARVKDLEIINKKHQELNGQLRKELESVRKTSTRVPR